jgi:Protein kinase domain
VGENLGGSLAGEPPAPLSFAAAPRRLGDYWIIRQVGHGGMGVVYEAVQKSLGRHVALKVLTPGLVAQGTFLDRFRREAQTAARLHHSNIVPVFGVGQSDGVHYYAMQFIHGQGFDRVLQDVRRVRTLPPDPPGLGLADGQSCRCPVTAPASLQGRGLLPGRQAGGQHGVERRRQHGPQ